MERAVLMQKKIAEQRKLPENIKEKIKNITFINFLISIAIMIYLLAINIVYLNEDISVFTNSAKIFAIMLVLVDIILFEIGYRKDNVSLWIHGFELLVCGVLILAMPYMYVFDMHRNIIMCAPICFFIYYVGKTILIYVIEIKKYQNNLSDVKEIIEDKEDGYLEDDISLADEVRKIEQQKNEEKNTLKQAKKVKKKGE